MSKYEWVQRCRMQFARRTQDFSFDWVDHAELCYDEMYEGFEEDPECCADEEMSYWD